MKFNKLLKSGLGAAESDNQSEGSAALYLRFGQLKKQLKVMAHAVSLDSEGHAPPVLDTAELAAVAERLCSTNATPATQEAARCDLTAEEAAFVCMLNEDVAKFNEFFMDAEEDAIVRLSCLKQQLSSAKTPQQTAAAQRQLVLFHGELILLLHWSTLNVTGLSKILKKHDKVNKRHVQLQASYLANALQQPFYSTDCISDMVDEVEKMLQLPRCTFGPAAAAAPAGATASAVSQAPATAGGDTAAGDAAADGAAAGSAAAGSAAAIVAGPADGCALAGDSPPVRSAPDSPLRQPSAAPAVVHSPGRSRATQADVLKRTQAALSMWQELGEKAHTPSTVLPPSVTTSPQKRRRIAQPLEVS